MLLEAKMETGWTNRQMCKKAARLRQIFGDPPDRSLVDPRFVLLSLRRHQRLETDDWPNWMTRDDKPEWMKLPRPPPGWLSTSVDHRPVPTRRGRQPPSGRRPSLLTERAAKHESVLYAESYR